MEAVHCTTPGVPFTKTGVGMLPPGVRKCTESQIYAMFWRQGTGGPGKDVSVTHWTVLYSLCYCTRLVCLTHSKPDAEPPSFAAEKRFIHEAAT